MSSRLLELGSATAVTAALLFSACSRDLRAPEAGPNSSVPTDSVVGGVQDSSEPFSLLFKTKLGVNCKEVIKDKTGEANKQLTKLEDDPVLKFQSDVVGMFEGSKEYIDGMVLAGCKIFVEKYPIIGDIDSSVPMSLACVALKDDPTKCSLLDPRSTLPVIDR